MRYGVIPACTHKFVLSEYFKENGCFSALKWPRRPARHCQCGNSERPLPTGFTPFSIPEIKNIGLLGHKHRHFEGKTAALLPEEVRCFCLFTPNISSVLPCFSLIFVEKPSANSPFSPSSPVPVCTTFVFRHKKALPIAGRAANPCHQDFRFVPLGCRHFGRDATS